MRVKGKLYLLLFFAALAEVSVVASEKAYAIIDQTETIEQTADKDFQSFLDKFTTSSSFQYSRIKFPLETPITLILDNGDEKTFPFTQDKWPLLNADWFKVGRTVLEEGEVCEGKYVVDEPKRKEFETGYEESELDLRIVFDLIDGRWYVTDCYNAWYSFDLSVDELEETIQQVQLENKVFEEEYP